MFSLRFCGSEVGGTVGGKKNTLAFSNSNSINRNYWNGGFICHFDLLCCYYRYL